MGHRDRSSPPVPFAHRAGYTALDHDVKGIRPVVPQGETLRRAVKWLSEQGDWRPKAVEEAARRFDLSPAEEEFLIQQFIKRRGIGN